MLVTNEILYSFINCQYEAYKKNKQQSGNISEFQILYKLLKQAQKNSFEKKISEAKKLLFTTPSFTDNLKKQGIALHQRFTNENIDLELDGVEFSGRNNIIPILLTPFERVMKTDKLFLALQTSFIHNEFNFQVANCKVVFGKEFRQIKFKLTTYTKTIGDLNKTLSNTNAPIFFKNPHCQVCEFQSSCLEKLIQGSSSYSCMRFFKIQLIQNCAKSISAVL